MKKIVKSMRGVSIDLQAMKASHKNKKALGNANMNANGDILGARGTIRVKREELIQAYQNNPNNVKKVSIRELAPDDFESPNKAVQRLKQEKQEKLENKPKVRKTIDKDN